ncbi:MAG TPA: energy transducer TonB [Polyangiaceae bacterium]|nr:energy transducer TonB [Polyangiaceae bacterium]
MARRSGLLVLSLLVHGALGVGVASIEIKKSRASTAISYAETQKKKKPPEPTKVDPTPPEKTPARALARRAAPAPAPADAPPPPKAADAPAAFDGLPDFGVSLTGGVNGTGIALPVGGGGSPRERTVEKVVRKAAAPLAAALPSDGCDEPPAKPKPISVLQPGYTDDAIAAAVEGKVRVQLTVDETGKVIDVKLIAGLGHGLDEAALAAARRSTFEPAVHCGTPTRATFTISMRFKLPT